MALDKDKLVKHIIHLTKDRGLIWHPLISETYPPTSHSKHTTYTPPQQKINELRETYGIKTPFPPYGINIIREWDSEGNETYSLMVVQSSYTVMCIKENDMLTPNLLRELYQQADSPDAIIFSEVLFSSVSPSS